MTDKSLLLVEGKNDQHVFYALLKHHQIPQFHIKNKEGVDKLLDTLPVELKRSDLDRLGIVIDANMDIAARWMALRNILLEAGNVDVPINPHPDGTIVTLDRPDRTLKVGIWLMPDNQLSGMLEHFVQLLVPSGDSLWARAVNCVERIPRAERRFVQEHLGKAQIHTWLAWQQEPGAPLGLAITKRYLDADAPRARQLLNWICRLFFNRELDDISRR